MTTDTNVDALQCPKCQAPMRTLQTGDAVIDRCEKCYGIWLDHGERLKLLKDRKLVDAVDIGPQEAGAKLDEMRDIICPRCGVPMYHVRDRAQRHIGFEFCRECQGSFFDAGELRDLSEFNIAERIRSFFGR